MCKFWLSNDSTAEWLRDKGQCRYTSPRIGDRGEAMWPDTDKNDWCGNWQPIDESEV